MPSMTSKRESAAAKSPPPAPAPATDAAASKTKSTIGDAEGVDAQAAKLAPAKEAKQAK